MFEWFFKKNNSPTKHSKKDENEDKAITELIHTLMKDKDINTILPDAIEKKLYHNLFTMLFALLQQTTDSIRIEFLNHKLTIKIEPITTEDT